MKYKKTKKLKNETTENWNYDRDSWDDSRITGHNLSDTPCNSQHSKIFKRECTRREENLIMNKENKNTKQKICQVTGRSNSDLKGERIEITVEKRKENQLVENTADRPEEHERTQTTKPEVGKEYQDPTLEVQAERDKAKPESGNSFSKVEDCVIHIERQVQEICGLVGNKLSGASNRVKLVGKIGDVSISLSLDTLADVSLMTEAQWIKIGRPNLVSSGIRLRGAFFSNSSPLGKCVVDIVLGSRTIKAVFLVVEQLSHSCIMGRDLLEQLEAKVSLSTSKNTVEIPEVGLFDLKASQVLRNDSGNLSPVVVEDDVVLSENSETLLQVKVVEAAAITTGMLLPLDHLPHGVMVAPALCNVKDNRTSIRVLNLRKDPMVLPKDSVIAGLDVLDEEQLSISSISLDNDLAEDETELCRTEKENDSNKERREKIIERLVVRKNLFIMQRLVYRKVANFSPKFYRLSLNSKRNRNEQWQMMEYSETTVTELDARLFLEENNRTDLDVAALVRLPEFDQFNHWIDEGAKEVPLNKLEFSDPDLLKELMARLNSNLSKSEKHTFLEMLKTRRKAFPAKGILAKCKLFEAKLEIPSDQKPLNQRQYPLQAEGENAITEELEKLKKKDVLFEKESPWNQPVLLVKKPNGTWRTCIDYRGLNKMLKPISIPIPKISDTLNALGNNKYFSTMDMESGFFQLGLTDDSKEKTCFVYKGTSYQYSRLPMGCSSSPGLFQLAMQLMLRGIHWALCLVYLDDVIVFSKTFDQHVMDVNKVLLRFEKAGVTVKPAKCDWAQTELKYLGFTICADGILPCEDKKKKIKNFKPLECVKDVRSFMGLLNQFKRFIPKFAIIANPLYELLRKNEKFIITEKRRLAIETLKAAIDDTQLLRYPNYEKPFNIAVDVCDIGVDVLLMQQTQPGTLYMPIAYTSRKWKPSETHYINTEKVILGILWALQKFKEELFYHYFTTFTVETGVNMLLNSPSILGRQAKYALLLADRTFSIKTISHQTMETYFRRATTDKFISVIEPCPSVGDLKLLSWNVNGLKSLMKANSQALDNLLLNEAPDLLLLSETKMNPQIVSSKLDTEFPFMYWNFASKLGYSGVAIFSRLKPLRVDMSLKFEDNTYDEEGRFMALEFDHLIVVAIYVPTVGLDMSRLHFRTKVWDPALKRKLLEFERTGKCIVIGGDLNITLSNLDFDTKLVSQNLPANTKEERDSFQRTFRQHYVDAYRLMHPTNPGYTFKDSYFGNWRLDYFLIAASYETLIKNIYSLPDIRGSDHYPVVLLLKRRLTSLHPVRKTRGGDDEVGASDTKCGGGNLKKNEDVETDDVETDDIVLKLSSDGASRRLSSAHGYVIWSHEWKPILAEGIYTRGRTCNEQEFMGLYEGLLAVVRLTHMKPVRLEVFLDSLWIAKIISGDFEPNNVFTIMYKKMLAEVLRLLPAVDIYHVARKFNSASDLLCNKAMDHQSNVQLNSTIYQQLIVVNELAESKRTLVVSIMSPRRDKVDEKEVEDLASTTYQTDDTSATIMDIGVEGTESPATYDIIDCDKSVKALTSIQQD